MDDPFDLQRFLSAQDRGHVYDTVLAELRAGRKRTHWIWFVFPQLAALGRSQTARDYGLSGADEARAYLTHPVLGPRLRECTALIAAIPDRSAEQIFGFPDYLKVRSCLTLFARCTDDPAFGGALDALYAGFPDGREDPLTLELLQTG